MIILDTNVVSELAKPSTNPSVVAWADAQPMDALYVTAISEAELLYGIRLMAAGVRRDLLQRAINTVLGGLLAGRVLPFDSAAAVQYADWAAERRRAGRQAGMADLLIAAIARARGAAAIATRNGKDFVGCGVPLVNPWGEP